MSLDYGRPASPEGFVMGRLITLNRPVGPERELDAPLPCYIVTATANHSDRFLLCSTVTVKTLAQASTAAMGMAIAHDAAWDAENLLISLTPGDLITLPNGTTAEGWIDPMMPPIRADYKDPDVKQYIARYSVELRFR